MKISHETKRAKKIIVELVRQAGGQIQNKSSLFRAFWKAHLHYAANEAGYLSTWPIIRLPSGPGIGEFDLLLGEMLSDGWLTLAETRTGDGWSIVFAVGEHAPPAMFSPAMIEAIRQGLLSLVVADSHLQSRVWRETKDGEEMEIYLDLMTDEERDQREANLAALIDSLNSSYATSRK